jgi:uncharacterized protein
MERIDPLKNSRYRWRRKTHSKDKPESAENPLPFSKIVSDKQSERAAPVGGKYPADVHADLEELMDNLHGQGERLKEQPTLGNIKDYRAAVSQFLQYISKHALAAEQVEGARYHPLKKQKKYILIKVVNEKLEQLATGILQSQFSQLDILQRVDEINGMVVDLLQ